MGLLGDMFAAGVQGAAQSYQKNVDEDIEMARRQALEEARAKLQQTIRREDSDWEHKRAIERAPEIGMIKRAEAEKDAEADLSRREKFAPRTQALAAGEARAKVAVEEELAPKTNKLAKDRARATHIESASSVAQAALANFQLDRAKLIGASQDALAAAEKSGDKKAVESARKQLSALHSKGDNPKDAQTMIAAQNAYLAAAKVEDDPEQKAALMASAKTWGDLAAKEMNTGGGNGDLAKLRELRDGGGAAKAGGAADPAKSATVKSTPVTQEDVAAAEAARQARQQKVRESEEEARQRRKENVRKAEENARRLAEAQKGR